MSDAKKLREALGDCIVGLDILLSSDQRRKIDGISHDLRGFLTEALEGAREVFIAPLQESRVANATGAPARKDGDGAGEVAGSIEEALKANAEVAPATPTLCFIHGPKVRLASECPRCQRAVVYTPAELAHLKTLEGA